MAAAEPTGARLDGGKDLWCHPGVVNRLLPLLLVSLGLGACKGGEVTVGTVPAAGPPADAVAAPANSGAPVAGGQPMTDPAAASGVFEDREHGVWFKAPTPDFRLLTGAAATALHPDAVVALENPPGKCKGYVTVTPAAGRSAQDAAAAVREGFDLRDVKVTEDDELLYCSKTGWRVEAWGTNAAGEPAGRRATFLVVGGRLYGVYALSDGTIFTRMRRCLDSVTAAFDLLDAP